MQEGSPIRDGHINRRYLGAGEHASDLVDLTIQCCISEILVLRVVKMHPGAGKVDFGMMREREREYPVELRVGGAKELLGHLDDLHLFHRVIAECNRGWPRPSGGFSAIELGRRGRGTAGGGSVEYHGRA